MSDNPLHNLNRLFNLKAKNLQKPNNIEFVSGKDILLNQISMNEPNNTQNKTKPVQNKVAPKVKGITVIEPISEMLKSGTIAVSKPVINVKSSEVVRLTVDNLNEIEHKIHRELNVVVNNLRMIIAYKMIEQNINLLSTIKSYIYGMFHKQDPVLTEEITNKLQKNYIDNINNLNNLNGYVSDFGQLSNALQMFNDSEITSFINKIRNSLDKSVIVKDKVVNRVNERVVNPVINNALISNEELTTLLNNNEKCNAALEQLMIILPQLQKLVPGLYNAFGQMNQIISSAKESSNESKSLLKKYTK